MPGLPPTPSGVIKVDHLFSVGSDQNANSSIYLAYSGSSVPTAQLTSLASAIQGYFSTNLVSHYSSSVSLHQIICLDLQNPGTPEGVWAGTTTGTEAGVENIAETAVLINFAIARRYRGGKPRVYLPFFTSNDVLNPQAWVGGSVTSLQTAWNAYITAIKGYAGPPTITNQVNVSYYSGHTWHQNTATGNWKKVNTPRSTPVVDVVSASTVSVKPASQRRRMVR